MRIKVNNNYTQGKTHNAEQQEEPAQYRFLFDKIKNAEEYEKQRNNE